tara:strand:+ start:205 stop:636 length:432 start_codon:yes stop_codon:yes gene_type:complete
MKYKKENNQILVVLEKGDKIMESLYNVAQDNNIEFGWVNGIGAIHDITIGSYPSKIKEYIKKVFNDEYELTSLIGNITIKDENPFVHAHVTISDEDCNAFGGHLFEATTAVTCEMIINVSNNKVNRSFNKNIGLYLWNLNCEK